MIIYWKIQIILIGLLLHVFAFSAHAQWAKPEKRIYLFDVTASMTGKGVMPTPNIFANVKKNLQEALRQLSNPQTEVVIIPFTDSPFAPQIFGVDSLDQIDHYLTSLAVRPGDTNLADAWSAGIHQLDSTKVNYLFLLTDGLHNAGPSKEILFERIEEWPVLANDRLYFAFYIMLTDKAKEQELVKRIGNLKQIWAIESMNVNAVFIQTEPHVTVNIIHNKQVELTFVPSISFNWAQLNYTVSLEPNPYYEIEEIRREASRLHFKLKERIDRMRIPLSADLKLTINYDQDRYPLLFFTPQEIKLTVVNRGIRQVILKEKS